MKKLFVILAVLAALAAWAAGQDQVTRPVIADASTGAIIWPNPTSWALANRLVQVDAAAYAVLTNTPVWTGLVATVAAHSATLTNLPAASVTAGNLASARMTNAVPALAAGTFSIIGTTQLVYVAAGVTNILDSDITTP